MGEGTGVVPRDKLWQTCAQVCTFEKENPMFVSMSQRTKVLQVVTDFTSRLNTLEWLPILLIRLVEGIVFVDSGRRKLFLDLAGFGNFFVELGIPFPYVMALVVASIEFVGGICLILGLGTRVAALAQAVIMANAIWTVQIKEVKSFSEFLFLSEFLSIGIFVWLAFTGPGKMSLDHWLGRKVRGSAQPR
jgi:putative oxidoreductase